MPEFKHRAMSLTYVIPADATRIDCHWIDQSGRPGRSTRTVERAAIIDFATWLSQSPEWDWSGDGLSFVVHVKDDKQRQSMLWSCRVSATSGREKAAPLPAGFYV